MVYAVAMGYKAILPVIAPNTGTNSKIMLNIYVFSVSKHRNGTAKYYKSIKQIVHHQAHQQYAIK